MFRRSTAVAASVVLGISAFAVPPATAAPAIPLSGGQETAPADEDGHGFFTYSIEGTTFCWTLSWQDIAAPTAAHIHAGSRHVAGPVVIPLDTDGLPGPETSGCRTITTQLAEAITADPRAYYVNVHNTPYPAGAIRGQLK